MLQKESVVFIDDNTDGVMGRIIGDFGKPARLVPGDHVKISVYKVKPNGTIKKGTVANALIISTRQYQEGLLGIKSKSSRNSVVLLDNQPKKAQRRPLGKITGVIHSRAKQYIAHLDKRTTKTTVVTGGGY